MADNKILDINEIIQNGVLIKKDLSNLDLSSLDLSNIEMSVWKGATFFNTCFKGTNIKFSPSDLKANCMCGYIDMSYCDFRDCDLSYLNEFDFYRVIIKGCNFFDTNLDINFETLAILNEGICDCFDLKDVTFSWQCLRQNPTNFDEYEIDVDTILKNRIPFVSSLKIQGAILDELNEKKLLINIMDIFDHVERYENLIKLDKQFFFRELYYYLKHEGKFDFKDSFEFFNGRVIKKHFDNLDLSFIPKDVLNGIRFNDCTFNSLTLPEDMLEKEFLKESENYQFIQANCSIGRVYIPNMTSSSWIKIKKSRIAQSPITFQTNLYLELERSCNANCPFCRNYCMDDKIMI